MERVEICSQMTLERWKTLMAGAVPMDYNKLKDIIRRELPELYHELCLDYYNPYSDAAQETPTHYILEHSLKEYFIKK